MASHTLCKVLYVTESLNAHYVHQPKSTNYGTAEKGSKPGILISEPTLPSQTQKLS